MTEEKLPRIVPPYVEGHDDVRCTVRLNFIAHTLACQMAKSDGRPLNQWLSRFLVDALENQFQEYARRIREERKAKEATHD